MTKRSLTRIYGLLVLSLGLTACNLGTSAPLATPSAAPTLPNVRLSQAQTTAEPTFARDLRAVPTREPTLTPTPQPTPAYLCDADASGSAIQHEIVANLNYETKSVEVAQRVHLRNVHAVPLDAVVFNVEANNWQGGFMLDEVRLGQRPVRVMLERNRLTVPLPEGAPLAPGCALTLDLTFRVTPPRIGSGITSFRGFFGYSERQINLALWLPQVAPFLGETWRVNEPASIGEQIVLPVADWDVTVDVLNAAEGIVIAAPGEMNHLGGNRWRFVLTRARDFSLSVSPHYRVTRAQAASGAIVELYSFPDAIVSNANGTFDGAAHTLAEAKKSLDLFEQRFGNYPYRRLLVVQGDFPDGMEFSGLVFVSTAWFYYFDGTPANFLTLITVHEVSHQWWYTRVGNDAARAPWLDEALATYSEYLFIEAFYPDLRDWWWRFRVANYNPQGPVDSEVYEFETMRAYINAVYLRGVQMLHNLRDDVGDRAFFQMLRDYVRASDGLIASSADFWSHLTPELYAATQQTRETFLRVPDVINSPKISQ